MYISNYKYISLCRPCQLGYCTRARFDLWAVAVSCLSCDAEIASPLVCNEHKGNRRKALRYVDGERATRNAVTERHGTVCPDRARS